MISQERIGSIYYLYDWREPGKELPEKDSKVLIILEDIKQQYCTFASYDGKKFNGAKMPASWTPSEILAWTYPR